MKMRYASLLLDLLLVIALTSSAYAAQEKAVFWASNPVSPGETAMVVGAGLGDTKQVAFTRLEDAPAGEPGADALSRLPAEAQMIKPAQVSEFSVKVVLPDAGKPGRYAVQTISDTGRIQELV